MYDGNRVKDLFAVQKLVRVISDPNERMMRMSQIIADQSMILDHHFCYSDRDFKHGKNVFLERHSPYFLSFRTLGRDQFVYGELAKILLSYSKMKLDGHQVLTLEQPGGYFLGRAVSQLIKSRNHTRHIIAKAEEAESKLLLSPNPPFSFGEVKAGDKIVIINDVDRSGHTLERLVKIVRQFKGKVSKVLVFATWNYNDFQKRMAALGVTGHALIKFRAKSWLKENCPECRQNNRGEFRKLIQTSEMS